MALYRLTIVTTSPSVFWMDRLVSRQLYIPLSGKFLQSIVAMTNSKRILEIGMFTGYAALACAEALPEDGSVTTLELDPYLEGVAKEFFSRSPHGKKISVKIGKYNLPMRSENDLGECKYDNRHVTGFRCPHQSSRQLQSLFRISVVNLHSKLLLLLTIFNEWAYLSIKSIFHKPPFLFYIECVWKYARISSWKQPVPYWFIFKDLPKTHSRRW